MEYSLCRLCLTVNTENESCRLSDGDQCELLLKIRTCLTFSLTINEKLPDKLCKKCVKKIDELNEFCISVKVNEQILRSHLENGTLVDFYTYLTSDNLNKEENNRILVEEGNDSTNEVKETVLNEATTRNNNYNIELGIAKIEDTNNVFDETVTNCADEDNIALNSPIHANDASDINNTLHNREIIRDTAILIHSKNNILDKYSCLTCNKVCESHDELREHYNKVHTNKNTKLLPVPTYKEIITDGKIMYKCDNCSKIYSAKYLKRHLIKHMDKRPYVCKLCSRSYFTVSDIMRHGFRVHSGIKLLCAYKCGFSSAYTGALKEHEERVHKNMFKYTCDKCGKGFQVKTWYDQHQNIHTGLKPFVCDICGHAFHMERYLRTHRGSMHPETVDSKRLTCLHCSLECETDKALESHLQTEHGVTRKKCKRMKKALCDLCGKILNRPEDLVLHRRMHLGQKPYKCSICNKLFPRKFSMQVHERSHSRIDSHQCTHCGKRYSQPSALYRHQRQQHSLPLKRLKTSDDS